MDRRERDPDPLESLMVFGERLRSELWTSLPGIIQSFDPIKQTCVVQPALQFQVEDPQGNLSWINMPLLVDCPVFFPSGGGITLTFPIAKGDECLVIFANRCIDAWWQNGCGPDANGNTTTQVQAEFRMHDLSDGMVLPGFDSVPNVNPSVSTSAAQLRNRAGDTFVEVGPTGVIKVHASASVEVTAPAITLNGLVTINGNTTITGTLTNNGHAVGSTHVHGGVLTGGGNTGAPT
jgi:hypothetical protein